MMIDRRRFFCAAGTGIGVVALAAEAQQAARLPRIGVLYPFQTDPATEVLRQGLQDVGYVEGRTAVIEWRWWEGKPDRLRDAAAELVRLNPDVIVVGGSDATKALKEATGTIPIVFIGPSYPVEEGLVQSFARPGGNVTGISIALSDTAAKLLQLLLEAVPSLADVSVIWSPVNPGSTFGLRDIEAAARGLNLKVLPVPMASVADVEPGLAAIARARPGALIVIQIPIAGANVERIADLAIRLRIPSITSAKALMERGLLMSYGADFRDVQGLIPGYVDRVIKGARPADMPVQRPTRFELFINMTTAKAIGLTIPRSLLVRADGVV